MMKKVFTLLTLTLLSIGSAWAGDVYKITFNGSDAQSTTGYFTNGGNHNFNTKFNGCTYDGVTYTSGLKMEGSTTVSWASTATATVTIVQSTWESKGTLHTIKLDGTALDTSSADDGTSGCLVYTITDVAAGSHSMTRGSGESGVFAIYVEYTGSVKTQLTEPVITFDSATGEVTIGAVANASKITYTTDGTNPTESSSEYTAAFNVNDGDVVKAIAIGDDVSYINSSVSSKQVLLTGIKISAPAVNQFNGTVAITCASPSASVEYSIDGGSSWTAYSRAFTVTATTNIKARASRASCTTSDVTDATITAVPANVKTRTLVMGNGAFSADGKVMTGLAGDDAEGFTLTMLTDQDKSWSGRSKIDISEIGAQRTAICGSNGVQVRVDMPAGVKATQLRLYSYVNSATSSTNSAWKEVNGENLNSTLNTVPMGAFTDLAGYDTNPDVRIFPLDNVENSFTFTNGGLQTCFVLVLDVIEPEVTATINSTYGWATFTAPVPLDFTGITTVNAYIVTDHNGKAIEKTKMTGTVPANTPLLLEGETTDIPVAASSTTDVSANLLRAGTGAAVAYEAGKTKYVLSDDGSGNAAFLKIVDGTPATVATDKAYLEFNEVISAPLLFFSFDSETTGVNDVRSKLADVRGDFFDLQGRKVANPTKGLYIVNGKKVAIK